MGHPCGMSDELGGSVQREGELAWKFGQSCLNQWINGLLGCGDGGQGGHVVKRDFIGLVEHGSGMRVVGMTGGNININNGVSANVVMPHV